MCAARPVNTWLRAISALPCSAEEVFGVVVVVIVFVVVVVVVVEERADADCVVGMLQTMQCRYCRSTDAALVPLSSRCLVAADGDCTEVNVAWFAALEEAGGEAVTIGIWIGVGKVDRTAATSAPAPAPTVVGGGIVAAAVEMVVVVSSSGVVVAIRILAALDMRQPSSITTSHSNRSAKRNLSIVLWSDSGGGASSTC